MFDFFDAVFPDFDYFDFESAGFSVFVGSQDFVCDSVDSVGSPVFVGCLEFVGCLVDDYQRGCFSGTRDSQWVLKG